MTREHWKNELWGSLLEAVSPPEGLVFVWGPFGTIDIYWVVVKDAMSCSDWDNSALFHLKYQ